MKVCLVARRRLEGGLTADWNCTAAQIWVCKFKFAVTFFCASFPRSVLRKLVPQFVYGGEIYGRVLDLVFTLINWQTFFPCYVLTAALVCTEQNLRWRITMFLFWFPGKGNFDRNSSCLTAANALKQIYSVDLSNCFIKRMEEQKKNICRGPKISPSITNYTHRLLFASKDKHADVG